MAPSRASANSGPDFLILKETIALPPTHANTFLSINDRESTWPIYLPNGITDGESTTRIAFPRQLTATTAERMATIQAPRRLRNRRTSAAPLHRDLFNRAPFGNSRPIRLLKIKRNRLADILPHLVQRLTLRNAPGDAGTEHRIPTLLRRLKNSFKAHGLQLAHSRKIAERMGVSLHKEQNCIKTEILLIE